MNSNPAKIPKGNILVVDDKPDNLRLLSSLLSQQGYKVRSVINGEMALTACNAAPPDILLLDINMPGMNGYKVCQELKANEKTKDIPVIFISALDDVLDKVEAFALGGADYIIKPFEVEEVLARIENQLTIRRLQKQLQAQNERLKQEICDRRRAEEEIRLLLTTTQAISQANDFHSALQVTLRQVCETIGWDFGEAWIPSQDTTVLECSRGWYASDTRLEEFGRQSQELRFAPGMGLPGRAWLSKQPEWIEDVSHFEQNDASMRSAIASNVGLKAGLAIPIFLHKRVLAVLVFFKTASSLPDERLIQLVNAVAAQLGTLIQRKKAEAALKQANQELKRLAALDGLTQVANRRRFDEYLNKEWRRLARDRSPLSLIMCDVDFFKSYNDTYGHQAGDDCLRQIASAISRTLKRPADFVARYGGEEFVVILPNTPAEGALVVAQSIHQEVENLKIPHSQSAAREWVTLSLGVSTQIPSGESSAEDLIAVADRALYEAKEQGRNQIVVKDFERQFSSPSKGCISD